jgi:hypothetical protein
MTDMNQNIQPTDARDVIQRLTQAFGKLPQVLAVVILGLKQIPGAEGVAVTSDLPATGPGSVNFRIQGESEPQANQQLNVLDSVVSMGFFCTSGIPLLRAGPSRIWITLPRRASSS